VSATGGQPPDEDHRRPPGVDDDTVAAAGKAGEALEWVERARGHLYEFHQLVGRADLLMGEAADALHAAGHTGLAELVRAEVVGRNVLPGSWTFQVVEEFDDGYYAAVRAAERRVRTDLLGGRRHVFEAEMKERRRTPDRPGHASRPTDGHG
jgi:hypothetical protein